MQSERDYLRDIVLPRLQEALLPQRIRLEFVDLRWGIFAGTVEEEWEQQLEILRVCLDEIDRCRPFMLVLLGDRYGWVPPEERLSEAAREKGLPIPAGMSVASSSPTA
jgi:hypothetical protein